MIALIQIDLMLVHVFFLKPPRPGRICVQTADILNTICNHIVLIDLLAILKEPESNDILLHFVEFSNVHNRERSSNAT